MTLEDALARLRANCPEAILGESEFRGEKSLAVKIESLRELCKFCHDDLGFDYLIDITSIDHFGDYPRYEIVYELYAPMASGLHLRLKTLVPDEDNPCRPQSSISGRLRTGTNGSLRHGNPLR
jgi:NADH-quinone oxidoreductase subunit C